MKVQGALVDYREATGPHTCHNCEHMNPDGSCERIYGQVLPRFVCNLWSSKK